MVSPIELASCGEVRLWLIELDRSGDDFDAACLSKAETVRAQRFVFPLHRSRYTKAHVALRQLLGKFTSQSAAALDIHETPLGKPFLVGDNACAFSLSHSHGLGMVAIAPSGDIGVDIEIMRTAPDAAALSADLFTEAERQEFSAACMGSGGSSRDLSFLHGWTRKEACLKAVGVGLGIRPNTVDVGLAPGDRIVAVSVEDRVIDVELHSFCDPVAFVAAVAVVRSSL